MWANQDFLLIFAAGNSGPSPGTMSSYSNAKNSVTVGGTRNGTDNYEDMYEFSSRGPAGDGRLLPDVIAPAYSVWSALQDQTPPSCDWVNLGGTSFSAPAVAGSAALAREYFDGGFYPTGAALGSNAFQPTAALVKAILLVSARHMTGTGVGGGRPNIDEGFGRLTLDDALWFTGDASDQRLAILDDRDAGTGFSSAGTEQTFTLRLASAGPVKVMRGPTRRAPPEPRRLSSTIST